MSRPIVTAVLAALAVGCSGQNDFAPTVRTTSNAGIEGSAAAKTSESAPPPRRLSTFEVGEALPPGRYVADSFVPKVRFTVGKGWRPIGPALADIFDLGRRDYPKPKLLTFFRPEIVYASDRDWNARDALQPPPADLVAWIRRHPRLKTSRRVDVKVGRLKGVAFDVEVASLPKKQFPGCPRPCVLLFQVSDGQIGPLQGERARFIVLEIGGRTVLIFVEAPPREWKQFEGEVNRVLSTVQFGAS